MTFANHFASIRAPRSKARVAAFAGGLLVAATAAATGSKGFTVIDGFSGPLFGLAAGRHGELLVADATGGVVPIVRGEPGTPIPFPLQTVTDVSPAGGGTIWALTGATGAPPVGPQNDTGQGLHIIKDGESRKVANLFQFEATVNPHTAAPNPMLPVQNAPDSNPYDVHALAPHAALVVDAGGNDLLRIDRDGNIKVLAVFPDEVVSTANIKALNGCPTPPSPGPNFCGLPDAMGAQAVPTSIAVDRHGFIYVGELRGFPAPSGESNIWRVHPHADNAQCGASPHCVKVFDGGFTSIIDLAFGPDGLLYVTELDEGSWAAVEIFRTPKGGTINACSVRWGFCYEVADDIPQPTAIAFDDHGALWATRNSLVPGGGEVVKIRGSWFKWWWHPRFFRD
jgi:hypothetical protein